MTLGNFSPAQLTKIGNCTSSVYRSMRRVAASAMFITSASRRILVQQVVTGVLIALMLLLSTGNVAQAAYVSTTATINNQTSYTAFPGEFMPVKVTSTRDGSTDWERTSYRYGNGPATCVNTPNHSDAGTNTETLFIPAPNSAGVSTLNIWVHSGGDCNTEPSAGGKTSLSVTVAGYPTRANNPDLIPNCGLNVILVLDESYSIVQSGAVGTVRNAANAFLDGLNNTGTSVAIVEFNTLARTVFNYTEVTGANLTAMKNYVNNGPGAPQGGYDPNGQVGYTNWDDALNRVAELNIGTVAPLVVFITDGDPTTYGPGTDIETSDQGDPYPANDPRMTHAVAGANIVKQQGSHMLTVGVGVGLSSVHSQQRLKDISGDDVYPDSPLDLKTTDVIIVANFDNLQAALEEILTELCAPSVTITKLVDPDTGLYAPAAGWQFSANARFPEPDGTAFNWQQPQVAPGNETVGGQTLANGTLTFQWDLLNQTGNSKITIAETLQPGYTLVSVSCQKNSGSGIPQTNVSGNTFTITGIANDAVVTCEVRNKFDAPPTIVVDKVANPTSVPESGGNVQFTFSVQNTSVEPVTITALSDDKFGVLAGDDDCKVGTVLAPNASCQFAQSFPVPAGNAGSSHVNVFTATAVDDEQNPATDTDDATVTYTTDAPPTVVVDKVANPTSVGEGGGNVQFTFSVQNTSGEPVTITALSDDKFGVLAGDDDCKVGTVLAPGATCQFAQSFPVPAGNAGSSHVNVFTATVVDDEQNPATDTDDATVTYTDSPPTVVVDKVAGVNEVPASGGEVQFTFSVQNTSVEPVTITSLSDDKYGVLAGDDDCKVGTVLQPNASCQFVQTFTIPPGTIGSSHNNIFTVVVVDDDEGENTATDNDDATVEYVEEPTDPTSLPVTDQPVEPQQQERIFLPALGQN